MPIPMVASPLFSYLASKTYNAAWYSGLTNNDKINAAIAAATADGALYVAIPASLLPHTVTSFGSILPITEGLITDSRIKPASTGFSIRNPADTLDSININAVGEITVRGSCNFIDEVFTPASTTSRPSLNIPHGTAPAAPSKGDMWTTTAGLFVRINGV